MRNLDSEFRERREQLEREEKLRRRKRARRRMIRNMILVPLCIAAAAFAFYYFLLKPGIVEIHLPAHTESEGPTIAEQIGEKWNELTDAFRPKWDRQEAEETAAAQTEEAAVSAETEPAEETVQEPLPPEAEDAEEVPAEETSAAEEPVVEETLPAEEPAAEETLPPEEPEPAEETGAPEEAPAPEQEESEELPEAVPAEDVQPELSVPKTPEAEEKEPEAEPLEEPAGEGWALAEPEAPEELLLAPSGLPAADAAGLAEDVQPELTVPETAEAEAKEPEAGSLEEPAGESGALAETGETEAPEEPSYAPFELPVAGAAGFAGCTLPVMSPLGEEIAVLEPGAAFVIRSEAGSLYRISTADGTTGYVRQEHVLVNLPDVVPSILYNNHNGDKSSIRSGKTKLPGITGETLYASRFYNERLGREQFVVPVLSGTARKLARAQKEALSQGYCLMVFEGWHSLAVQERIAEAFHSVYAALPQDVEEAWYTGEDRFNYHLGCGVDVSLFEAPETNDVSIGGWSVPQVTSFRKLTMPGSVGDLSPVSFVFLPPVSALDGEGWQELETVPTMTEDALLLQKIMTENGFTPLSSAWWHFNDLEARALAEPAAPDVSFELGTAVQELPQ